MALSPKIYQFLVCIFAAIGSFLYGYDLTIVASVTTASSFAAYFQPTTVELGLFASLFTGGAFFGAAFAYPISDRFGRRVTIISGGTVFCLGSALQAGARNYAYQISGRIIGGAGVGILLMIVPMYQAELAHPTIRGLVTGLQQFMLGVGGIVGSWLSYGTFVGFEDNRQWRIPLGVQIVPGAVVAGMIFLFPESPRWLIQHGKVDQGTKILADLHANGNTSDAWVVAEARQILVQVTLEQEAEARSFKALFATKANSRRIILACAIQAATQMTGVSAIQYFSPTIFRQIGISDRDTLKYQAINSILGVVAQFLLMLTVDWVGRRPLIIASSLAMSVTYIIGAALLAEFPPAENNNSAHWAFVAMTWLFNFCFNGLGSLSWIIPAEIFDTATRAKGVALGCMTSFAFNTMIGQVTPIAMENIRWCFYLLFVVMNITNAIFFWAALPETKKLPLEEMNRLFSQSPWFVGWRDMSAYTRAEIEIQAAQIENKQIAQIHVDDVRTEDSKA